MARYTPQSTFDQERNMGFLRSRCQAAYRGEAWDLTREEFFALWSDPEVWANRGRKPSNVVMVRKDSLGAWSRDNVMIIGRYEQLIRNVQDRKPKGQGKHKEKMANE